MKISKWISQGMKHINTILFVSGFIFDMLVLPAAGHLATIIIGAVYLGIVALAIAVRELIISRNTASSLELKLFNWLTFAIAYFSGSSLSFISVYVIRGAELSVSWPLLLILFMCVLVNELISSHSFRFTLDVGVFLIALLFYVIFNFPSLIKAQNDVTFAVSVGITIIISLAYLFFLQFTSESASYEAPRTYALAFGIPMFLGMLYFLNMIPAVPLSLRDSGVYNTIVHTDAGEFIATGEQDSRPFAKYRMPVHYITNSDSAVYFFSNIQTPAELTAPISHTWEYYDESSHLWIKAMVISFDIKGGREEGYRAFSEKENITEGLWRVTVKIGSNRIIGRQKFQIIRGDEGTLQEVRL